MTLAERSRRSRAAAAIRRLPSPHAQTPPPPRRQRRAQPMTSRRRRTRAIAAAREYHVEAPADARPPASACSRDRDLEVVRLLLPAALAIPGAVLACFSAMGHVNNPQSIVAIATVTDDAMEMLQTHLQAWLKRTQSAAHDDAPAAHLSVRRAGRAGDGGGDLARSSARR